MHPERVSNIRPFINKFNWSRIKYPSKIEDWETFEKNNSAIALNVLYIKEMEICPAYVSKINWDCEKQIILLMIPNEEKEICHYLVVKKLSVLLRGTTSKHQGYWLLQQKTNLNLIKKSMKKKIFVKL